MNLKERLQRAETPRSAGDLATEIERQFSDPSCPARWDDFSDAEWRIVIGALREIGRGRG